MKKQQGFALLMALLVISVVVSIGLSMLDLTLKQIRLSTNSKDSEIVFYATNAGLECGRYWLNFNYSQIETGANISPVCFGVSPNSINKTSLLVSDGNAYKYDMDFTWGALSDRCTKIELLTLVSDVNATTTVNNMPTQVSGYPKPQKECGPGGRCSVISIQGFNKACSNLNAAGTLQREVLLEL